MIASHNSSFIIYDYPQEMFNDAWYFYEQAIDNKNDFFQLQRFLRMAIICIHSSVMKYIDKKLIDKLPFTSIASKKKCFLFPKKKRYAKKVQIDNSFFTTKIKLLKHIYPSHKQSIVEKLYELNKLRNKIIHYDGTDVIYNPSSKFFPTESKIHELILAVRSLIEHIWTDLEGNDYSDLHKIFKQTQYVKIV